MKITLLAKMVIIGTGLSVFTAIGHASSGATWSWENERNQAGEIIVGSRTGKSSVTRTNSPNFINLQSGVSSDLSFDFGVIVGNTAWLYNATLGGWLEFDAADFDNLFDYDYKGVPQTLEKKRLSYRLSVGGVSHTVSNGKFAYVQDPCLVYEVVAYNQTDYHDNRLRKDFYDCTETGDNFYHFSNHEQRCSVSDLGMLSMNTIDMADAVAYMETTVNLSSSDSSTFNAPDGMSGSVNMACDSNVFFQDNYKRQHSFHSYYYTVQGSPYEVSTMYIWTPFCYSTGELMRYDNSYRENRKQSCLNGGQENPSIEVVSEIIGNQRVTGLSETMTLTFDLTLPEGNEISSSFNIDRGTQNSDLAFSIETLRFDSPIDNSYVTTGNAAISTCEYGDFSQMSCTKNVRGDLTLHIDGEAPIKIPLSYNHLGNQGGGRTLQNDNTIAHAPEASLILRHSSGTSSGRFFPSNAIYNYETNRSVEINSDMGHSIIGREIILNAKPNAEFFRRNSEL